MTHSQQATIHVFLRTPLVLGKIGNRSVLDALLFHRLMLIHNADAERARADMPLDRLDAGLWACGGGYDPYRARSVTHRLIFRRFLATTGSDVSRLLEEHNGLSPQEIPKALSRAFGMFMSAMSSGYPVSQALQVDFRMQGNVEQVLRLLQMEPFLGPGQSCGYGEIDSVSADWEDETHDVSWLLTDPDGCLTRPIPDALSAHIDTTLAWPSRVAIEAPYWQSPTQPGWRPRSVESSG